MNKTALALGGLVAVCMTAFACRKPNSTGSNVLFDGTTASILRLDNYTDAQRQVICSKKTLMVFVGNAEPVGTMPDYADGVSDRRKGDINGAITDGDNSFMAAIAKAASDLEQAVATSSCTSADGAAFMQSEMTLAVVIDGPGFLDSDIKVMHFRPAPGTGVWGKDTQDLELMWDADNSKLVPRTGAFELSMPDHLPGILQSLARFDGGKGQATADIYYDRINYLFKTHGGMFSDQMTQGPNLTNPPAAGSLKQVLFFDTHGPNNATMTSDLFYPIWTIESGCLIWGPTSDNYKDSNCADALAKASAAGDLKPAATAGVPGDQTAGVPGSQTAGVPGSQTAGVPGSQTAGVPGSQTAGVPGSQTAGVPGSQTAGVPGSQTAGVPGSQTAGVPGSQTAGVPGSQTAGVPGSQTAGVPGSQTAGVPGSQTAGVPGSQTAGVPGSQTAGVPGSQTAGVPGSQTAGVPGSQTAGVPGSQTAGIPGDQTAGAGKGYLFSAKQHKPALTPVNLSAPDASLMEGLIHVGKALTYTIVDTTSADGIDNLALPIGNDTDAPILIVLDSCYGSDLISSSMLDTGTDGDGREVVSIFNPKPLYFDLLNYGVLNASGYITMPYLFMWEQQPSPPSNIEPLATALRNHFSTQGLAPTMKMRTAGATDHEYMRLTPSVAYFQTGD